MRIYASRQYKEVYDFVGKDIWVRYRVEINGRFCYGYIRILSQDPDTLKYKINEIDIARLSRGGELFCTETGKQRILDNIFTVDRFDIKLLRPLEFLGTDEIFITTPDLPD